MEDTSSFKFNKREKQILDVFKKAMVEVFDRRDKIEEGKKKETTEQGSRRRRSREELDRKVENLSNYMMMIPPFQGNNDPDEYLNWEKKCEITFRRHNIADINRVKLAAMEFKYYALSWWKQVETARAYSGAYEISTWEEMKRVMRQRFVPSYYQRELHSKLRKHSQGTHSVEEYYSSHGETKPKQPDKITQPYPRRSSKAISPEPQENIKSHGKHSVSQQLQELTFCRSKDRDHVAEELPSQIITTSTNLKPVAHESIKRGVQLDHAGRCLSAKGDSVQTPCYDLQEIKEQENVSASNKGKVQTKLSLPINNKSMTGIMHLSFSKSVETGTGVSEEQWEEAHQEKEAQPRLDPPKSKPPDQLQGLGVTRKETDLEESPTQVLIQKPAPSTMCLTMPKEIRPEPHIQSDPGPNFKLSSKEIGKVDKADLASRKISFQVDSLLSILHSTQVSEAQNLIYYWDHFIIHQKLQKYVFKIPISSIMHLFFSLSVNKGAGLMEKHKDLEGTASKLIKNQEEWFTSSNPIPEKPPDSYPRDPKQQTQDKYLNSQRRMKPKLLSLGAGKTVLRTKLFEVGEDDAIMDDAKDKARGSDLEAEEVLAEEGIAEQLKAEEVLAEEDIAEQFVAEDEDDAEQGFAEQGFAEPGFAEPGFAEGDVAEQLVAKEAKAGPMEQVTHYGVMLEPRWRRHDPKPPWFLIQAQEISKWACVSFVLFFPCQVLSQWVFLTRFLMRRMGHIQITHFADQDPGPSKKKTKNVAMKIKGHICVQTLL